MNLNPKKLVKFETLVSITAIFLVFSVAFSTLPSAWGTPDYVGQVLADNLVSESSYTISRKGDTYYAVNGTTRAIDCSGADPTAVIQASVDNSSKGTIIVKDDVTLSQRIKISQKNISFFCYGTITLKNDYPDVEPYGLWLDRVKDATIFIYKLDGNKSGNLNGGIVGLQIQGCENLKIQAHITNCDYTDVSFYGTETYPNKNIEFFGLLENNGNTSTGCPVFINGYNAEITISGKIQNTELGQALYMCNTNGFVHIRDLKLENITGGFIDIRQNVSATICNVVCKTGTGSANGMTVYSGAIVYINGLKIESPTLYGIENYGTLLGSNLEITNMPQTYAFVTRGGNDFVSLNNLKIEGNSSHYCIEIWADSAGNHKFIGGKLTGGHGIKDDATNKSLFYGLDLTGLTGAKVVYATKVYDCDGYVTENTGTTTIANNEWVSHGLAGTPTAVTVTTRTATYDGVAIIVGWVGQNSTHFQVSAYWTNATAIVDDAIAISWDAVYQP